MNKAFMLIVITALVPRLAILWIIAPYPSLFYPPDSKTYEAPALNLLAGNGFAQESEAPYTPDIYRTPVYPAFIAAMYAVAPYPQAIALAQIIIASLTAGLTYTLGRMVISERAARLGGVLLAISPVSILYSLPMLTETLFTFLLIMMTLALAITLKRGSLRWAGAAGLLLGVAILCRPIALLYPPAAAVIVACKRKSAVLPLLGGVLIIVAPWVWRNYAMTGVPAVSLISNLNLLYFNAARLEAHLQDRDYFVVREEIRQQVEAEIGKDASAKEKNAIYGEWGKRIILEHPAAYVYTHLAANLRTLWPDMLFLTMLFGLEKGETFKSMPGVTVTDLIPLFYGYAFFIIVLYAGVVLGVIDVTRRRDWLLVALLAAPAVYLLLIPGAPATPRFRVPAQPFICLLAGVGITYFWAKSIVFFQPLWSGVRRLYRSRLTPRPPSHTQ